MLDQPEQKPEQQIPAPTRSKRKWIALGIGGGCALIACAGLVVALAASMLIPRAGLVSQPPTPVVQPLPATGPAATMPGSPAAGSYLQQSDNTIGDPNAPVKIIEYADFQCPYCLRYWQETEPQIIEQYVKTGQVFYEYRSVGDFIGPESDAAAQAAYCAGDQNKFWAYHNTLYSNWTGENVGDFAADKLKQYATAVGLDRAAFDSCLNSGKYASRIQQDVKDAKAAGIQATPSFVINGKLLEGAQPFGAFQQAIDAALKGP